MQPYHEKNLQNAIRLPALNWNLAFFGGHFQQVKRGWHIDPERHLAFELIHIISGSERVRLNQHAYVLSAGDILIIPPNLRHDITCLQDMAYFNFHFNLDDSAFSKQLIEQGLIYYPRSMPATTKLLPSLTALRKLIRRDMHYQFSTKLKIQKFFTEFLIALNQQTTSADQATNLTQVRYAGLIASEMHRQLERQIQNFTQHQVDPRLSKPITVENVIKAVQISLSYGSQIFKETYGISPRTYLSQLKLHEAKQLLLIPDYSIAQLSVALGYTNQSIFARQFKRWTGMTPNQFRNHSDSSL